MFTKKSMKIGVKKVQKKDVYIVTEGIEGYWHYHLSLKNEFTKSLCGISTMQCSLPYLSYKLGIKTHLNEKYCQKCIEIMNDRMKTSGM
jgi:hypothetical protein